MIELFDKLISKFPNRFTMLRLSCVLTLVGLGLCLWALFDPRPIPVILAMSAAQGIGTVAFMIYLGVIAAELRRRGVLGATLRPSDVPPRLGRPRKAK